MALRNNLNNVVERIRSNENRVSTAVAEYIKMKAEENTPMDSGHLKNSWEIWHGNDSRSKVTYIGNIADYALYVEKGTRHTPAHNMLTKAVENNMKEIQRIAERAWEE